MSKISFLLIPHPSSLIPILMTPERWQQVKDLFQAARECAPGQRAAFLEASSGGDAELRAEVESLLASHEQPGRFMDQPAFEVVANLLTGEPAALVVGREIGPYRVLRKLGQGGMGQVYLAQDTRLGRSVALKLLHAHYTRDADRVHRFQQEAHAASALNHPNIITIYEVGQVDGLHFIAAEFVEGETLRPLIRGGGLTLGGALDIALQVAGALAAAHQAGIVHRDIKPENIMRRPDGYVKVLDFGLAKLSERPAVQPNLGAGFVEVETQPGMVMGTVAYMSPEQARGQEVDSRTDLFSLGVVLYELLTGRLPFEGGTTSDVIAALLGQEPPPLVGCLPAAPVELQRIVSRALAKPVAERSQTVAEMLGDLRGLKQELEFAAKLKQAAVSDETTLATPVGPAAPASADQPTVATGGAAVRTTANLAYLMGYLQRRGKWALLALAALVLVSAGVALGLRWVAPREQAINSIAVLPFVNVGADPQMEYLPDGITESVIDSLAPLPGLTVMARSTVFTYKGKEVDPRQVGATLKVRAVVMGRVQRQGDLLVVRAELVDAADGSQLWSEQYQRPLADLVALQEEIAREISTKLRLRLSGAQWQPLAKRHTTNKEAHQLYLKGRHFYHQGARASQEKALDYFKEAVALDPGYALAWAEIAQVYAVFSGQYLPPGEAMPKAREAALKALALDDHLAEAHYALGLVKQYDWDRAGAEQAYKRAIELNPNLADAVAQHGGLLVQQGRFEEGLRAIQRAEELDPLSLSIGSSVFSAFYYARQYDRAIAQCRKLLELNPSEAWEGGIHASLGRALIQQQRHEEAIAALRRAVALNRHNAHLGWLGYAYAAAGRPGEARELLRELEEQAGRRLVSPVSIARIYLGLGEKERALALLRQAYDEHSDHVLSLGIEPIYDPLRSDPRFIEMLRGIGLAG